MLFLTKIVSWVVLFFGWLPKLLEIVKLFKKSSQPTAVIDSLTNALVEKESSAEKLTFEFQSSSGWSVAIVEKKKRHDFKGDNFGLLPSSPSDSVLTSIEVNIAEAEVESSPTITETVMNYAFYPPKLEMKNTTQVSIFQRFGNSRQSAGIMGASFIFNHTVGLNTKMGSYFIQP